ncbi:MAG: protein-glutamate O-methyltransferase [Nitrospirae bacterium]|nr:protein-glutamate O-methyltransferase [Nitrospirota bacterium]NTW66759.1 protein-glutamate O-methyltransferase [Nitrospirota bacterium]
MNDRTYSPGVARPMTQAEFARFSEFIIGQCGIKMPPSKKIMLEARLQKRLRALGVPSYGEYYRYIHSESGRGELVHMLDAVTTNKTDFFREPIHFQYLAKTILPEVLSEQEGSKRRGSPLFLWSAGCSTGEEPYTLAMVLSEFAHQHPTLRFSIMATDISTKVLDRARDGIYDEDRIAAVPDALKQRYLLRSRDRGRNLVRIVPELRAAVQFKRLNLMEESFSFSEPLDVIFCRNVIIYFDRSTQERLISRFCRVLRPDGYLFLGHSESVHGFDLPLRRITSTVYRKIG